MAPSPSAALFYDNVLPGDSVVRTVTVINQDPNDTCSLVLDAYSNDNEEIYNGLASQLSLNIDEGTSNWYIGTLDDFFLAGPMSLGSMPPSSTKYFDWTVALNPEAGNEYQNARTIFDFDLAFECLGPATPTPTPSSTVLGLSAAGAPVCNDTVPASAPFLSVITAGSNSMDLDWTSVTPATHYMIRYGLSSGNYIYGAPNVGNITGFLVEQLSGGTTYYFQVAGVNGCMPGPWSNEATITPTGQILVEAPAPGFEEVILGEATIEGKPTPISEPAPEVAGASVCEDKGYPWWIFLVIQLIIGGIYAWMASSKKEESLTLWIPPIVFGVISQLVHWYFGCNCATGPWCQWYWLFNLLIVIIGIIGRDALGKLLKSD